jgi:hypothetical protein
MWSLDAASQQRLQQYAKGDASKIDKNQEKEDVQKFVQNASPDVQQEVFKEHFAQIPADQRAQLATMFPPDYHVDPNNPASMAMGMTRAGREHPEVLHRILDHPIWLGTMVALLTMIARRILTHH